MTADKIKTFRFGKYELTTDGDDYILLNDKSRNRCMCYSSLYHKGALELQPLMTSKEASQHLVAEAALNMLLLASNEVHTNPRKLELLIEVISDSPFEMHFIDLYFDFVSSPY